MTLPSSQDIIRDPEFAKRLKQACDANFHCPPDDKRGRLTWIKQQLESVHGIDVSLESVRRWVKGVTKPKGIKYIKLAELLGVDDTWLYTGKDPLFTPRESKVRNAMADGTVNIIAGFIAIAGGHPAFPAEDDVRAKKDHIDLYAIIKGANYAFHVTLGQDEGDGNWMFPVPAGHDNAITLGVVRRGFAIQVVELTAEIIAKAGKPYAGSYHVALTEAELAEISLESFAKRL